MESLIHMSLDTFFFSIFCFAVLNSATTKMLKITLPHDKPQRINERKKIFHCCLFLWIIRLLTPRFIGGNQYKLKANTTERQRENETKTYENKQIDTIENDWNVTMNNSKKTIFFFLSVLSSSSLLCLFSSQSIVIQSNLNKSINRF